MSIDDKEVTTKNNLISCVLAVRGLWLKAQAGLRLVLHVASRFTEAEAGRYLLARQNPLRRAYEPPARPRARGEPRARVRD